ncbi:MAG TPA: aspartate aminotransferase family protein [Solirubrobacteraceae bacterium]|jgi:adenosylmethionine-8-amino-7-oxononanoate aminotransferase
MPADTRLWHPFADMHAVRDRELVIARGEGVHVWDEDGTKYLDGTASLWCVNVGHGRQEIAEAVAAQMRELATYQTFGVFANRPALDLAERLAAVAPLDDPRIFLVSGGGDAIDTAAKLARRYFAAIGQPERTHLISRSQGYHGTHGLGTSIGGIPSNREGVGPLDPDASIVPWDSVDALAAEIERLGAERVAAVFVEPVIGAGGVLQPPSGYVEGVAALCERTGVLFVCDSVIAAFGRLGTWFGAERFDVRPDLLTFAKGVTSGYLPLGGVVAGAKVAAPFWDVGDAWFRHGPTYAGHPTVCAAAMANLDIIERENLLARGRELEDEIGAAFGALTGAPLVGEIRTGIGALAAVAFAPEALAEAPDLPARLFAAGRERGVLVRPLGDGVAFSPALIITREEVEHVAEVVGDALEAIARDVPAAAAAG